MFLPPQMSQNRSYIRDNLENWTGMSSHVNMTRDKEKAQKSITFSLLTVMSRISLHLENMDSTDVMWRTIATPLMLPVFL